MAEIPLLTLTIGELRRLTREEKRGFATKYKYCTLSDYSYSYGDIKITVPRGFLTDGSSGGPDYGVSWLFHDYLYSTHAYTEGGACTRRQADSIMKQILKNEGMGLYHFMFTKMAWINPFWGFSRAWNRSGARGPEFIE